MRLVVILRGIASRDDPGVSQDAWRVLTSREAKEYSIERVTGDRKDSPRYVASRRKVASLSALYSVLSFSMVPGRLVLASLMKSWITC